MLVASLKVWMRDVTAKELGPFETSSVMEFSSLQAEFSLTCTSFTCHFFLCVSEILAQHYESLMWCSFSQIDFNQGGEEWQNKGNKQLNFSLGASQIPERLRQAEGTDLSKARRLLALSSAPRSLACREQERDTIANFVRETVQAGQFLPSCALFCQI